jgi:hypothetical protein
MADRKSKQAKTQPKSSKYQRQRMRSMEMSKPNIVGEGEVLIASGHVLIFKNAQCAT